MPRCDAGNIYISRYYDSVCICALLNSTNSTRRIVDRTYLVSCTVYTNPQRNKTISYHLRSSAHLHCGTGTPLSHLHLARYIEESYKHSSREDHFCLHFALFASCDLPIHNGFDPHGPTSSVPTAVADVHPTHLQSAIIANFCSASPSPSPLPPMFLVPCALKQDWSRTTPLAVSITSRSCIIATPHCAYQSVAVYAPLPPSFSALSITKRHWNALVSKKIDAQIRWTQSRTGVTGTLNLKETILSISYLQYIRMKLCNQKKSMDNKFTSDDDQIFLSCIDKILCKHNVSNHQLKRTPTSQ